MSETPDTDERATEQQLAVLAARLYYLEDLTKVQIADRLQVSRFKVARLLTMARETGIVTVAINQKPQPQDRLTTQLQHRLGLRECIVIPTTGSADPRRRVAAAGAGFLSRRLVPDDVLGLSWGRTLALMTEHLIELPPVKVVQLTGSLGSVLAISPIEILRRATSHSGGAAIPIMAPLVADNAEAAAMMREQSQIRLALDTFSELTVAMLSVGSWEPATTQMRSYLDEPLVSELEAAGVEGEVSGIFLTRDGEVIQTPQLQRLIGITADELRTVPEIVVVAEGVAKAGTVVAAVRAGIANTLIIDVALATAILELLESPQSA
ncbi:DNA-binding transcriptional regulator [Tessaracoccus terricola]